MQLKEAMEELRRLRSEDPRRNIRIVVDRSSSEPMFRRYAIAEAVPETEQIICP